MNLWEHFFCLEEDERGHERTECSTSGGRIELLGSLGSVELRFGALPYRAGQPMLVQGDVSKFVKSFGHFENTPLNAGLEYTITYYKKQHESI